MGVTDIGEIPIVSGWRILCGPKNARYPPHAGVSDTPAPQHLNTRPTETNHNTQQKKINIFQSHHNKIEPQPHLVILRKRVVSSTPRLLGSITDASGILDRPPSRTMTAECVSAFSRRKLRPRLAKNSFPQNGGSRECRVHAAPAVSCA